MLVMALFVGLATVPTVTAQTLQAQPAIVIHGGAGTILPDRITPEQEQAYREAMQVALETGYEVLQDGGSSPDAVVAALQTMEASPLFNAGKGAVFTSENTVELDASIMDGATRSAGALTGVKTIKSPIALAQLIMEESPHVMLAQEGAETFAEQYGVEQVENRYFYTERRRNQAEAARQDDGDNDGGDGPNSEGTPDSEDAENRRPDVNKFGTVGAAALDRNGNLAAGTSTGGMTNKRFGRVGDSPIIGAGTYADNTTCAVSSTGHGEYFIRAAVAHDISARMKHGGQTLQEAAHTVIHDVLPQMSPDGGTGGVIALDRDGNIAMPFNTPGMYRGYIDTEGTMVIRIFQDEDESDQ